MDLLKDFKMSLLNFSFIMIYTIHKILVLIKNHPNYLKDNIFECFFKEYQIHLIFFKKIIFFILYNNLEEENRIKGIRNLFVLKKRYKKT